MKKEKRIWAVSLIALGWLAPLLTNAQQDSIKSYNLNEVVITATKFPKSISETGKALTVIDREQLERSSGKDLSQLLNEQVGIVINGANSNPGKDKSVYLRGAKSDYTVFLIDGIPVNDPSGAGGAFDPRLLSLDQLDRIEILKGSQSTLYGSDAIAGVINLITKKGTGKKLGGNASLSYGSYDMLKVTGNINGSTELVDYNFGYSHLSATGISEAKDLNQTGLFDKDGFNQNAISASASFKINNSFNLTPFFRYMDYDGEFDGGSFTDDNSTYKSVLVNPGLRSRYMLKKGAINLLYGHNKTDREFNGPFGPNEFNGRFDNSDLFVNYNLTEKIQFLGGLNYQNLRMLDGTLPVADPSVDLLSPYTSLFFHNVGGFSLELGGRYNHHSKYGSNSTYSFNPSYTFNNRLKVFINQSTGFKAPTLSQLYGNFGGNENLKPEKSNSSEAGIHWLNSQQFDIRITAFKRTVKDVIIYTFADGSINLDEQNDFGFEVEPTLQLNNKIRVAAHYAFVDGEVTTQENGSDSTYFNLFRRPKHTIGVNFGVQATNRIYVSINLKTFSKRTDLFFNPNNFFIAEEVTLEGYSLLDLYAEYKLITGKLKIFVDAKNLLNQNYSEVYGYNTLKFNLNSGLSFTF